MLVPWPVSPVSYEDLKRIANPQDAGEPQAFWDTLYDVRTYTDNSSLELEFFATTQTGITLSNLTAAAVLPQNEYFAINHITLDLWPDAGWTTTAAGGVAGLANDLGLLLFQGRPVLTLTINNKRYGPRPALEAGGSGGVWAFGYGTFTAEESIQFGSNAQGGMYHGQALVIPPLVGYKVEVDFAAAQDLTDDYRVRCGIHGTHYRQVV